MTPNPFDLTAAIMADAQAAKKPLDRAAVLSMLTRTYQGLEQALDSEFQAHGAHEGAERAYKGKVGNILIQALDNPSHDLNMCKNERTRDAYFEVMLKSELAGVRLAEDALAAARHVSEICRYRVEYVRAVLKTIDTYARIEENVVPGGNGKSF